MTEAPLPITLIIHWANPPVTTSYDAICQYCAEEYELSPHWPFTNACTSCTIEQLHDLIDLVDHYITLKDASWRRYKPALEHGFCPLCHTYDPKRDLHENRA